MKMSTETMKAMRGTDIFERFENAQIFLLGLYLDHAPKWSPQTYFKYCRPQSDDCKNRKQSAASINKA